MRTQTLAALESETAATVARVRAAITDIRDRAADEGRAETAQERAEIDRLLTEGGAAKGKLDRRRSDDAMRDRIAALDAGLPLPDGDPARLPTGFAVPSSLGAQFVRSEVFEWLRTTKKTRPGKWESPTAELAWPRGGLYAATITTGGGALVVPVDRGLVPPPPAQPHVADLFAGGPSEGPVSYLVETAFANNAAPVAEGAVKPESGITFERRVDPLSKIAHWIPVTDEALDDIPQMAVYVDTRLREGVLLKEDLQLIGGDGVSPNVLGILNRAGLGAAIARGATESNADAIARARSARSRSRPARRCRVSR